MPSMDIVNKLDMAEVINALEQARKEINQRYDFKGTNTSFELNEKEKSIAVKSTDADKLTAAFNVMLERMMKRNVSPKVLDRQKLEEAPGGIVKQTIKLKDGITDESAKKVVKLLKDAFPKGLTVSINGDLVRATSKSRDQLQEVITFLRGQELDVPLQFTNRRD